MSATDYLPTIGIECHVQLKTKTKLFAAVGNDAREAAPNTLISHICLGMPGALPVLNQAAIELAMKAAYALKTKPQKFSAFDRKHYFYPDLPKGYQISQLYHPIIIGGHVDIDIDGKKRQIGITRAHLEEDAGKSTHPSGSDYSLVDLNRAGTPLLEIVSEPDIHSATEAKAYARELYLLMRYAGVSDADLYYGNMRFDVNVSVSKDPNSLGNRTETKNLNSFRSVEKAVEYEIKRQISELEQGRQVVQETRGWDDDGQKTFSQRSKEDSHDYRYMPDPDIPPVVLDEQTLAAVLEYMPKLPAEIRNELARLNLDAATIETLVETMPASSALLEAMVKTHDDSTVRRIALWFAGELQGYVSGGKAAWETLHLDVEQLIELSKMADESKISSTGAKTVLIELVKNGGEANEIATRLDLMQVSDTGAIEKIVDDVIFANEKAAQDVRMGEEKAIGFLVGQVMKLSKGKANPGMVQTILKQKLLQ